MPSSPLSLNTIPVEVLHHISFFAATHQQLGPPSALPALLRLNKRIHHALSQHVYPLLYARIFLAKFDGSAPLRRLGAHEMTVRALGDELRRRFDVMGRVRRKFGACVPETSSYEDDEDDETTLHEASLALWTLYIMLLENTSLNERQLREYAHLDEWLMDYWFHPLGASCTTLSIIQGRWPPNNECTALAMWLFWLLLRPETIIKDDQLYRQVLSTLKPLALAAHRYHLCHPTWTSFLPASSSSPSSSQNPSPYTTKNHTTTHVPLYAFLLPLSIPPLAAPAILAYLVLANHYVPESVLFGAGVGGGMGLAGGIGMGGMGLSTGMTQLAIAIPERTTPSTTTTTVVEVDRSRKWDYEWARCNTLGASPYPVIPAAPAGGAGSAGDGGGGGGAFKPGSIEGVWEGIFTYTEFTSYAALLSGAPPSILQKSLIAQHRQTWKLREHHLVAGVGYPPLSAASSTHSSPSSSPASSKRPPKGNTRRSSPGADERNEQQHPQRIPPGDPLRAYFPNDAVLSEGPGGVDVTFLASPAAGAPSATSEEEEDTAMAWDLSALDMNSNAGPTSPATATSARERKSIFYRRFSAHALDFASPSSSGTVGDGDKDGVRHEEGAGMGEGGVEYARKVRDIIITGEGHSAWGEFRLLGRVRPCDGFVSISKEYIQGDRGKWLYRGYLVGTPDGNLVGRWRDTLSPAEVHGYEGCFGMTRRM
ncbi:hypothetical protein BD410DRAFT_825292 [Rickenella mellea]|uniref:F-box domain-containing protein n=1 Tax=Rickenella mellea TaxID=50990 RepID=A0A4Y7QHU3_9AGAM|nr:hypothetical protein BD410DRAFT_825292 [Rickenella mellea]